MIRKIFYTEKTTKANTTYYNISPDDMTFIINKLIQITSYMGEISLTKKQEVKDFVNWYKNPSKSLPYSHNWKRYNSPQSFISGVLNNLLFGNAKDISDITAAHLQSLISEIQPFFIEINKYEDRIIQTNVDTDTILFQINIFESNE